MEVMYNLGCGGFRRKGFVNVDKDAKVKPDICEDVTMTPWRWAKQADLIFADNLFEHIGPYTLLKVVQECHRILKPDGLLQLRVPIVAPDNLMAAFSDPTHVSYFTVETFDWYDHRHIRWKKYGRAYGIPEFERLRQQRQGRFLIVELKAVK